MSESPFVNPDPERVFHQDELVKGIWDAFPVSPGHALLVPVRVVPTWFEASAEEQQALLKAIDIAKKEIENRFPRPDGYNIGINVGAAAGQTVFHLHVHVIPRYEGDVVDPRGGVRHVIPDKANYLVTRESAPSYQVGGGQLVSGGDDPLLPHLLDDMDRARQVDIAVAFVMPSGVELLEQHLLDLLEHRDGRLRIVTGDYLDVTDPDALQRLLDLPYRVEIRLFQTGGTGVSFHPKSYLLTHSDGSATAYVGSSNLSKAAFSTGVEWNYRVLSQTDPKGLAQVQKSFEKLFRDPATVALNETTLQQYRDRRRPPARTVTRTPAEAEQPADPPEPHEIQKEALRALKATREAGNGAGLVVLATGLGKTWLSAFDSADFEKVLFVAHREEILGQAMRTYRRIRPGARLGLYTGKEKTPDADVLFASVQTLGKMGHLKTFARGAFDYIVVDEFHHAAAMSYRKLISYFEPHFLLGITATPERSDGGDLLGLCGENVVYRCGLVEGIKRGLLCPFHYHGVPDEVDYENIPWRSGRFNAEALTTAVATQSRADNALEQYQKHGGKRTVVFCCSQLHADFMAEYFRDQDLRAVAVHSGPNSAPRASSLHRLGEGELDILCCVDMFNEGLDLPQIDTVMMLRPTESRVLWLQQLGRGLRKAEGKENLQVIDYIGNHRTFLTKPQTLLMELGNAARGDMELAHALKMLEEGKLELPPGCEVTYELSAVDILKGLLRKPADDDALKAFYEDYQELHGTRPTALEVHHQGYNPGAARKAFGSWLGFVGMMGGLDDKAEPAFQANRDFLESLERTQMTKSYKMVLLSAMLNRDCFPGSIGIDELTEAFAYAASRSAALRQDVSVALDDLAKLRSLLIANPVKAWCGGKGTGRQAYFAYEDGVFRTVGLEGDGLVDLVRELVEWRLAQYLERRLELADGFVCKVSHASGRPMLFLPERKEVAGLPFGSTKVIANDVEYEANFVKVALNVMKRPGSKFNELPAVLRRWFGAVAGAKGTRHRVKFTKEGDALLLEPINPAINELRIGKMYAREEIPALFGLTFNTGAWNQGLVVTDQHVFLLVTLEKDDLLESHQYADRFLSDTLFEWQSQNRTTRDSKHGRALSSGSHKVHLFVRKSKKKSGRAAPFSYCGELQFVDWDGNGPITVTWRLASPLTDRSFRRA